MEVLKDRKGRKRRREGVKDGPKEGYRVRNGGTKEKGSKGRKRR